MSRIIITTRDARLDGQAIDSWTIDGVTTMYVQRPVKPGEARHIDIAVNSEHVEAVGRQRRWSWWQAVELLGLAFLSGVVVAVIVVL